MNLEIFKNTEFEIRVAVKNDEPLFCLSDVCKVLEIQNTADIKKASFKKTFLPISYLANPFDFFACSFYSR